MPTIDQLNIIWESETEFGKPQENSSNSICDFKGHVIGEIIDGVIVPKIKLKNNLDKWNFYKAIIDSRENNYIQSETKDIPKVVYEVAPIGTIKKLVITGARYNNGKYFGLNSLKNRDILEIKAYAEANPIFERKNIIIGYEYDLGTSNGISGFSIDKLSNYLTKEQAEAKSLEIIEKNKQEEILLQNGHTRCRYCKNIVPDSEIVKRKIIGRGRKNVWNQWKNRFDYKAIVTEEMMNFCSGNCAGNEQMSREG